MSFFENFNASNVNPNDQFSPLPAGNYEVMITDAEIRHTKDGQGTYMRLALDVQSGQYQGRKIFHNLTRENRNNVAKEIGERQLSQICHAIGVLEPKEKEDILFKPLVAVLKIRKGNEGYSDSNEVQRFQTLANSNGVPSFSVPPQATRQQASSAPWAAR